MNRSFTSVQESLQIFYLLKGDISASIDLLDEKHSQSVRHLAYRSLHIDLVSFIDELKLFVATLHTGNDVDVQAANRFLLTSHKARKVLNKRDKTITLLRNIIFAHNYRHKSKKFADPLEMLISNYQDAPFLQHELEYLGEIALLIIRSALKCFYFNAHLAFVSLRNSLDEFKLYYPLIEVIKNKPPEMSIDSLERDIYQIEDALKAHSDNYKVVAKQIKCTLRDA